ncbi:MAG: glycosyl transferase [Patescibacteria group bacterium]|nr:MAG: glycosyl transferase [Patescibacteria group bacterium]
MNKTKKAGEILNQGAKLLAEGKAKQAITLFKKSINLDDKIVAAHFDLALAYMQTGDELSAIESLKKTTKLKPDDFEAFNLLGHLYMNQKMVDLALPCFLKATKINPMMAEAHYNLGVAYMQKKMFDKALSAYKKSLKVFPNNSIVFNNIGVVYEDMGNPQKALEYFKKAIKVNPQNATALQNIGAYYIKIDPKKSKEYFEKATKIEKNSDNAFFNLGVALRLTGDTEGSIAAFEKSLKLNPNNQITYGQLYHQLRDIVDFKKAKKLEGKMRSLSDKNLKEGTLPAETIFVSVIYDDNPKRNLEIAKAWSRYIEEKVAPFKRNYIFAKKKKKEKIKIGYLSNDFKDHATSHLLMGVLREHNRSKFEIYAYSYSENDKSYYRKEIEKLTKFRDILTLSDQEAADLIYKDKIDILVDLKGHTTNSRLEIAALRPAPVQIHYLGFPGSVGADFIDYFITDKILTPPKLRPYFSEKLIYMPHSYQANDNKQKILKSLSSRKQFGLPEDAFLFASFNQPYKITEDALDAWSTILKKAPKSAILFLAKNQTQVKNITSEFRKRKIDVSRIFFSLPIKKSAHLARLSLCDAALDTFICNGHTTTSDALWAGIPVITLLGKHFASRVSASLLCALGVPELITKTKEEYINLAVSLAKDTQKAKEIKEKIKANRLKEPLFDTTRFTRNLEKAYIKVWENYLSGKKPRDFVIKDEN